MVLSPVILAKIFSYLDIEDRVRFERVSRDAKTAVADSWRSKKRLLRGDDDSEEGPTGWLCVPGNKRCEIVSKMTSLRIVDIEFAIHGTPHYYHQVVDTIVSRCPVVRRIYNDYGLNLHLQYYRRYKSQTRIDLITCYRGSLSSLREIMQYAPAVHVRWVYDGESFPEMITHVVASWKRKMDIFGDLCPALFISLKAINLVNQKIWSAELDHICSSFPSLKSLKVQVCEPTSVVVKCLQKLESLEVLEVKSPNGVNDCVLSYLKLENSSSLVSITFDNAHFSIEDFVEIVPIHLRKLKFAQISARHRLILGFDCKSVEILWIYESLEPVFAAFPKVTDLMIKSNLVHHRWSFELKEFAIRRPHKRFDVFLDPGQKSIQVTDETDNITINLL